MSASHISSSSLSVPSNVTGTSLAALAGERLPSLTTKRLVLRWLEPRDVPDLFNIFSHPEVARYTSRPPLVNLAEARAYLERIYAFQRDKTGFQWGVTRPGDDRVVGTLSLFHVDVAQGRAEVGYMLARDTWGLGYVHESMGALLGLAFGKLGLRRIEADVDPRNVRSVQVLERLGFLREGLLRERWCVAGEIQDTVLFGLLAREWRA